mgnify:CR=1 FL=1
MEMDGVRLTTRLDIPKVGEHTRELLERMGYGARAIAQLQKDQVILAL